MSSPLLLLALQIFIVLFWLLVLHKSSKLDAIPIGQDDTNADDEPPMLSKISSEKERQQNDGEKEVEVLESLASTHHRSLNKRRQQRCFYFGPPETTIPGADYAREYGLSRAQCAERCQSDPVCMAFEWNRWAKKKTKNNGDDDANTGEETTVVAETPTPKEDDEDVFCTLKTRSLNGSVIVVTKRKNDLLDSDEGNQIENKRQREVFFGLCLDHDDPNRDRFWDHELTGVPIAKPTETRCEHCPEHCRSTYQRKSRAVGHHQAGTTEKKTGKTVLIYSWNNPEPRDLDFAGLGVCQCLGVLNGVRLSFGSVSGFVVL